MPVFSPGQSVFSGPTDQTRVIGKYRSFIQAQAASDLRHPSGKLHPESWLTGYDSQESGSDDLQHCRLEIADEIKLHHRFPALLLVNQLYDYTRLVSLLGIQSSHVCHKFAIG